MAMPAAPNSGGRRKDETAAGEKEKKKFLGTLSYKLEYDFDKSNVREGKVPK